ncbi:hypothetical protein AB1Y20_001838 [Prymnesium parvum]|uniref:Protein kinase domain-containing protein n=1 Tax=Prymnesium parvum TaxID=97485 RepID=A0AB34KBY7_PRYPA
MGCCLSALEPARLQLLGRPDAELPDADDALSVESLPPGAVRADVPWSSLLHRRYHAEGAFSQVFLAVLDAEAVALKILKEDAAENELARRDLEHEARLLASLSHRHVVRLLGCGTHSSRPFLLLEPLAATLASSLPKPFPDHATICEHYAARARWPRRRAASVAVQLSRALRYLHAECAFAPLLHRDLKPDNVGFAAAGRVVLFDFGLARESGAADDAPRALTGKTGSTRYMSPEVALCKPYNSKADVFSFATLLWQMLAHERPFSGMSVSDFEQKVALGGHRPKISSSWPPQLQQLLSECWEVDAHKRPPFVQIVPRLEAVLRDLTLPADVRARANA